MRRAERDRGFSDYVVARRTHLKRAAYLLCGDVHQAEDLVQTTLAKLYVAWPRVQAAGNPEGYVRRVLVNAHLDDVRRPWRRERPVEDVGSESPSAAQLVEDAEVRRRSLVDALRRLPEGQRRVVVLRHYWDLSVAETAHLLGVSPGTVKSQTSVGLSRLAEALGSPETDADDDPDDGPPAARDERTDEKATVSRRAP